ncbi:MAG: UbiA family prenyltransferase [Candidatus Heimdallarchaeota archaeon]
MSIPSRLWVIIRLTRFEHSIIGGIGVIVGAIITTELEKAPMNFERLLAGILVAVLLIAAGFALNDLADVEVDKLNKRFDRPLVTGELTKNQVILSSIVWICLGIIIAIFLGLFSFVIATIWLVLAILYDFKLKEFGLIGNIYVATTYAAPWFYGSMLFFPKSFQTWIAVGSLSLIAFVAGFGREILKGIMDIKGDRIRNVRTVARTYGTKKAAYLAILLLFSAIILTPLPYYYSFNRSLIYLLFVSITNLLLIGTCIPLLSDQSYATARKARNRTLIAFILGSLAFLGGVIGS